MHGGLALVSLPVRWGWLQNITPLSRPLKWAANLLKPFGSDRGGMLVRVTGTDGQGKLTERFNLLSFAIDLEVKENRLCFPVIRGAFLGVPIPRFLLPKSETSEYVDAQGRTCFDVNIALPVAAHVVSYRGLSGKRLRPPAF